MTAGARRHADARLVVQTWFVTRLLMALVGLWLMVSEGREFTDLVGNWDVQHFLAIASKGYAAPDDIAFFPGWPLLLRLASVPGTSMVVMGTFLALLASGFAAAALFRLAGAPAAIAWLLAPTAVFTMVPYTESVFCAAAFWAWERATAKQWAAAAVLASVAAAVRVSGVFLIVALVVLALTSGGSSRDKGKRLLWLLFPVFVVVAYLAYLYSMTGNWLAWYDAQATGWSRGFTWPWDALRHTFEAFAPGAYADHPEWAWVFRAEVVSMAVGVVVTLVCLVRRRWAEATWVGLQVGAFSVSYWFMSVNRAVLLWFPLWTLLGELGESKRKLPTWRAVLIGLLVAVALVVQVIWAWLFFTGRWAS
ncbi:MAG TPA: mannosyltransferase family protein [Propionicimonas sp.]|nr:mannosyltransferase family protein [Propionicimonas sp.]